jgi:hypothetical protein
MLLKKNDVIIHNLKQELAATTAINVACKKCILEEDDSHVDGEHIETTTNKKGFKYAHERNAWR